MKKIDLAAFPTPYFVVDEARLRHNLAILKGVCDRTGCKILTAGWILALGAFFVLMLGGCFGLSKIDPDYWGGLPLTIILTLFGMTASTPLVFSPAYREEEFVQLLRYADDFVFNSPSQLRKYGRRAKDAGKSVGLRINPECSTQEGHAIYDPCAPGSRLGTTLANFDESLLPLLDGLHFHTLLH